MNEFHKGGVKKVEQCRLCEIGFPDRQSFIEHLNSASHKNKIRKEFSSVNKCPLCAKTNMTKDKLSKHLKNSHHSTILFLHNLHKSSSSETMNSMKKRNGIEFDCPFCTKKYYIQDSIDLAK